MPSYSDYTDNSLAVLIKERNKAAFTEIYNRYWLQLYLHARQMLRDEEQSRDTIQEIFTQLWNKASEIEFHTSLKSYLYTAVKNHIINYIRHEKVTSTYLEKLSDIYENGEYHTDDALHFKELQEIIEAEIQNLPKEIKKVFEMSRKEHLSNAEIALKLEKSEQTIKNQISRAIQILRKKLNLPASVLLIILKSMNKI